MCVQELSIRARKLVFIKVVHAQLQPMNYDKSHRLNYIQKRPQNAKYGQPSPSSLNVELWRKIANKKNKEEKHHRQQG